MQFIHQEFGLMTKKNLGCVCSGSLHTVVSIAYRLLNNTFFNFISLGMHGIHSFWYHPRRSRFNGTHVTSRYKLDVDLHRWWNLRWVHISGAGLGRFYKSSPVPWPVQRGKLFIYC